jgi:hypothetical protein
MRASDVHKGVDDSPPISNSAGWLRVNKSGRLSTVTEAGLPVFDEMIVPFMNLWIMLALFFPLE